MPAGVMLEHRAFLHDVRPKSHIDRAYGTARQSRNPPRIRTLH